jgi:hypothetical protein
MLHQHFEMDESSGERERSSICSLNSKLRPGDLMATCRKCGGEFQEAEPSW